MKGSVALLAGALPALVSCSHALPPVREINTARSTPPTSTGLASAVAFVVRPNPFPTSILGVSGLSSSRSNAPRRSTHPGVLAFVPALQCAATHKRPGAGAVSFGSSSIAGVEGAFEAAAAAGLDRDPIARGVGVDGGVGAPAEATAESGDEASLDAFSSAVASCAVVDEGELICQKLEGVVSREAEVAEQEVLLRVAHLDDYFAIAGEYIRRFHRPLPWSWELICRQLEEVVSQEAEVAEEQILLRMANLGDYYAISCEYTAVCFVRL